MIISASRRTDIPAFYTPWFIDKIKKGFLLTRNPFNANQVRRVSLKPEDVDVLVFWTRNPGKLIPHLGILDALSYSYYFQYTITGYPRTLEAAVPRPLQAVETFINLSNQIGKDRVVWRYDPILLSNKMNIHEHKRLFSKLAGLLAGKTNRVVISFSDFYKKTERNLNAIDGLICSDITLDMEKLLDLSKTLAEVSEKNGMSIQSCAESVDTDSAGIPHGKCIDDGLIKDVFGLILDEKKDKGQREACGCIKSTDIGMYNTCLHECAYCYATFNKKRVVSNRKKHDEFSPFLIGNTEGIDQVLLGSEIKKLC